MSITRQLFIDYIDTPIGQFVIIANEHGELCMSGFTRDHPRVAKQIQHYLCDASVSLTPAVNPGGLSTQIDAYFCGALTALDQLPAAAVGTAFQHKVWRALRTIPCGETCSYSALARQIGQSTAARAVGLANGKNPLGVIVPCHRVIGANGTLTGYGGGIARKRWLLAHERSTASNAQIALFDD
ncbi:MAG: methylated-DNA-[protein]-cysteine S-methyltransferase [Gammaproteobacteria bacterium]